MADVSAPAPEARICNNCEFFLRPDKTCHAGPPTVYITGVDPQGKVHTISVFPNVEAHFFCGAFMTTGEAAELRKLEADGFLIPSPCNPPARPQSTAKPKFGGLRLVRDEDEPKPA